MSPSISEDIPAPTPPRRPAPRDPLANALFLGLCALVALAPLPLGAARPLAWDVMGLWVAALLLGSLWLPLREPTRLRQDLTLPALLLAAVMAFVVFQAIPFGPGSWHNPVWEQAGEALGRAVPAAIAVDPQAALIGLFRYAMYAGIFYLAYLLAREAVRARRALKLVSWAGTGYAAYGLIVYGAGNRMILWLPKIAYPNDLTATFVNKNSFATYTGLALLATLALIVDSFVMRPRLDGDWRDRVRIAIEFLSPRVGLFACLFVQATALLLAHSRGGSVACLFGILLLVIAVSRFTTAPSPPSVIFPFSAPAWVPFRLSFRSTAPMRCRPASSTRLITIIWRPCSSWVYRPPRFSSPCSSGWRVFAREESIDGAATKFFLASASPRRAWSACMKRSISACKYRR